jgi:hypothetical protein
MWRVIRRTAAGTALVLVPSCSYVAYKYRPRASFDIDYHESLVRVPLGVSIPSRA